MSSIKKIVISPSNKKAISFIEEMERKKEEIKTKIKGTSFFKKLTSSHS